MARFGVDFADPKGFFYPGEKIVGHIIVKLDKAIKCKKVTLKFKGESQVLWDTGSGNERKTHSNHEVYFENAVTLMEPPLPDKNITLYPGEFNYPFQFQLPADLPPSAHTTKAFGFVHYFMKIGIVGDTGRIFKSEDIKERIYFKVVAPSMDLNEIRDLLEPWIHTEDKYLCCLCCQSGPIRLCFKIQKRVYYVGEKIVFSVEVDNKETDKPLGKIEAKLIAFFTFISKSGNTTSVFTDEMSSVRLTEGLPPRSEKNWHDVTLNIPTYTMPTFDNCKCMHLDYFFKVKVKIASAFDPEVLFPITISSPPETVQPVGQPPFMPGNLMPTARSMVCPPSITEVPPPMGRSPPTWSPPAGYSPTTCHTQPSSYPPPTITQQPAVRNQLPPPYPDGRE